MINTTTIKCHFLDLCSSNTSLFSTKAVEVFSFFQVLVADLRFNHNCFNDHGLLSDPNYLMINSTIRITQIKKPEITASYDIVEITPVSPHR